MGDLLGIIVVICVIVSALSSNAKKKKTSAQKKAPTLAASTLNKQDAPQADSAKPRAPVVHLYDPVKEKQAVKQPAAVKQVAAPRVAPQVHVTRHEPDMFAGSMNAETHEGEDPCHEEQLPLLAHTPRMAPVPEETPGLTLEWTGDAMVKAIVMQEVLTRPCDRRRRG